ncbi:unnamed protein product [Caenorhabditis angaria]|uniref:Integrase zinc-binding domain-containing protein n=1 Tax=Caenorhabditis angaria TaxID=860376 RepID=A0A9P1J1Q8_9PELO|nr:unnamed protein product [Caenorhabditis angaria]
MDYSEDGSTGTFNGNHENRNNCSSFAQSQYENPKCDIFCDNEAVLKWVQGQPGRKEIGTFIYNRLRSMRFAVSQIESREVKVQFGYVRSKENPADLGTRGVDKYPFGNSIWWDGPKFCQEDTSKWDSKLFEIKDEGGIAHLNTVYEVTSDEQLFKCERSSSLAKCKRIAAYVLRFIWKSSKNLPETRTRLKNNIIEFGSISDGGEITAEEMKSAEQLLIKQHQKLISGSKMMKLKDLNLEVNEQGIIVCKGRFQQSESSDAAKFPVLIAEKSELAKRIIREAHGKWHSSIGHTMANVRTKYWIPKLRQQVKHQMAQCVKCQRFNGQPMKYPNMASLPKSRVIQSKPFETVGIDYFGPIDYKTDNETIEKAYGIIFTCSTTRLIHLEVVTSMDTSAFFNIGCLVFLFIGSQKMRKLK